MRLLLNKRGLEKGTLVLIILMLLAIVGGLFYNENVANAAGRSAEVTACRQSVNLNSVARIGAVDFPTTVKCPARTVKITKPEDVSAKKMIAEEMADCWYQYGEGRLNLFREEETFCAVCAFINVESEKPVTGLLDYLKEQEMPDKSGRYYFDYLTGFKTAKAGEVIDTKYSDESLRKAANDYELKGKSTHAVLFVYAKGKSNVANLVNQLSGQTAAGKVGGAVGIGLGVFAGVKAAGLAAVFIAPGAFMPPVWAVVAVGAAAGFAVYGATELVTYLVSPENVPEWAAFTVLRPWNKAETSNILRNELGCTYFPAKLE